MSLTSQLTCSKDFQHQVSPGTRGKTKWLVLISLSFTHNFNIILNFWQWCEGNFWNCGQHCEGLEGWDPLPLTDAAPLADSQWLHGQVGHCLTTQWHFAIPWWFDTGRCVLDRLVRKDATIITVECLYTLKSSSLFKSNCVFACTALCLCVSTWLPPDTRDKYFPKHRMRSAFKAWKRLTQRTAPTFEISISLSHLLGALLLFR